MMKRRSLTLKSFRGLTSRAVIICLVLVLLSLLQLSIGGRSPTDLSGFGSRSLRKTIFPLESNMTALTNPTSHSRFANHLSSTDRPKLWVRRTREPDTLHFQIRDDDGDIVRVLRTQVVNEAGDWDIEEFWDEIAHDSSEWIPVEGVYGLYKLPSGIVWVLVTKTSLAYTAPSLSDKEESWWQIRRVENFELVHLSSPDRLLSTPHLKEEVRQLRLLRQALKEHDFYFVPTSESQVVKDMTSKLQDSIGLHVSKDITDNSTTTSWWSSPETRPDPRFFWNHAAVEPIFKLLKAERESDEGDDSVLSDLLKYTIPLTSAFVGIQSNVTDSDSGLTYDQLLISRRSRFRAGTRFTRRGADGSGTVANFVETEQVCLLLNNRSKVETIMSHLQTRGSIPLRWSSPADVKTYRPRVRIGTDPLAQARALRLHLLEQFSYYVANDKLLIKPTNASTAAKLIFVNLIDKHKDQGRLGRAFDAVLRAVMDVYAIPKNDEAAAEKVEKPPPPRPRLFDLHSTPLIPPPEVEESNEREQELLSDPDSVEHVWFDFHAEVKDGRWDRLTRLLAKLQPALDDQGSFIADASNNSSGFVIRQLQNAVVRTNCMDCLDRTNVVQGLFGRYVFVNQLKSIDGGSIVNETSAAWKNYMDVFEEDPTSIPWENGEVAHRHLWADNADAISRLYAGTPALKGDFTRTGKRTRRGALDDGMNSLQRYYLNNFLDADRQEGMDLMVGYADFSNAGSMVSDEKGNEDKDGSISFMSIKQATRENFFGKFLEDEDDARPGRDELSEGMEWTDPRRTVDLRWIPGDLQCHMISNAEMVLKEIKEEKNTRFDFEFTIANALAAIDRRSASDLPWWAEFEDDLSVDEVTDDNQDSRRLDIPGISDELTLPVPEYQQFPRLEKSEVFALLLFGVRGPISLAAVVVALLILVFLPDVV